MIKIDGIEIDDDALFGLAHDCAPERFGAACSCCRTYEVCIDAGELPLLDGGVANASAHGLIPPDTHSIFERLDDGQYCLDTDEEGQCLLAMPQPNGASLCALHSMALQQGLAPYLHKPRACTLWPVAATEGADPALTVTPDALEFPCNRQRRGRPQRLHRGIAEIIDILHGRAFRRRLEACRIDTLSATATARD